MLLAVDVGNTNISMGIMEGEKIRASFRLITRTERTSDELGVIVYDLLERAGIGIEDIEAVVISSVVPKLMYTLTSCMKKYIGKTPIVITPQMECGIALKADNPRAVGADRIVDCAYAYHTFKRSCIVVDFGTATTFDYVNGAGEFRYTVIAPGLGISASALTSRTAKLPEIEIKKPASVLGSNTITGMQAGVVYGYIGAVEYILKKMKAELQDPDCYVVATGGLGRVIANETDEIDAYDPDIAYKGIRIIYELNRRKNS
ncbi:MAG: type III pantothenate kinase [Lactimicrobium sp.]|jgi:type III pantothenate kinase|uniref:type III pantothenate kinase n=1 Tax=Lactimicrobium sp. TaxID=2563780 RepID=UPI002F35B0D5